MASKKKIMFVVGVLRDGGAQRAAGNISMALENDYDISFVTFSADNIAYGHGGTLYDLRLPRKKGLIAANLNEWKRTQALRRIKKQIQPDVCISFLDDANLPNVLSKGKEKTVVSLRTHLSSRPMGRLTAAKVKYAYSHADKVVCVSEASMTDLVRKGFAKQENCVAIGNMVDAKALLARAQAAEPIEKNGPVVATMGTLSAQKGMWNLIRAFKTVAQRFPSAKLLLFGGAKQDEYTKLIAQLGLQEHVFLQGFVKNPHAMLRQADLFVFPSRFEGMPNALLEAMAIGLPVISTDCLSGPREILAPGTDLEKRAQEIECTPWGVLLPVPQGDFLHADAPETREEALMAQAICEMLANEDLCKEYAAKSLERVQAFSPEEICKKWIEVIES